MKISQTIVFTGLAGFVLVGLIAPAVYAAEDGQFPVFPTVIEDGSTVVSPPAVKTKITVVADSPHSTSSGQAGGPGAQMYSAPPPAPPRAPEPPPFG